MLLKQLIYRLLTEFNIHYTPGFRVRMEKKHNQRKLDLACDKSHYARSSMLFPVV